MVEQLKEQIKVLLKIPPQPEAPFGAPGSIRIFRAAPGFFRYRMLGWTLQQIGALAGILFVLWFFSFDPSGAARRVQEQFERQTSQVTRPLERIGLALSVTDVWALFEIVAIAGFVIQLPFTFLMVFLDYEYRWYITTDRSLRIREGLLSVEERTMTFSNVQNVSIKQGPLQRFFGISDLEVSSAGGGGAANAQNPQESKGRDLHRAYFRGISNPAEIRDAILVHLRGLKASGLGDPDEDAEPDHDASSPTPAPEDLLLAARNILEETRGLRRALS